MDHVLIDRSASGFDFRRRWPTGGLADDGCLAFAAAMTLPPPRSIYGGSLPYPSPLLPPPPSFQRHAPPPYHLHSALSLPPLPPRRPPPLLPLPPAARRTTAGRGEFKRKKQPRAPRPGGDEPAPPRAAQRRKPLQRAAPLPPAPAVHEALDDLEREVTRGFVQDLVDALAPPPSSLPLPTFSLVRASAVKAAAASCAV